jgi:transposase
LAEREVCPKLCLTSGFWTKQRCWQIIHDLLRQAVRHAVGKRSQPTAAILDCQAVRSADQAGERGYDAAKKTKGIKRHILVDILGLLLAVCVTKAEVPERAGARSFLDRALAGFRWLRCLWADQGYGGDDFAAWVAAHRKKGANQHPESCPRSSAWQRLQQLGQVLNFVTVLQPARWRGRIVQAKVPAEMPAMQV